MERNYLNLFWDILNLLVEIVGWIIILLVILTAILTFIAWIKGILKPLWRLGLGLARKNITIVGSQTDSDSLLNLIRSSEIFTKNVTKVCSREDMEDIKSANIILFKYSGSSFSLEEVLEKKSNDAAIVIYAKPGEIPKDSSDWALMDQHRNISVCNLKGRLLNDLLTLMMTTKL